MDFDSIELKHLFAVNLLRYDNDANKAAFQTVAFPGDALQIARAWPDDPVVQQHVEELLNTGEAKSLMPTKERMARDVYKIATGDRDSDVRLKAHRLYAEIMGFIEKPSSPITNNILNQGVMIVKEAGSNEEWEQKALAHQRTLTGHATATVN